MERKVAFLPFCGTNCLIPYGRTENVVENCIIIDDRNLKQMTKDLVMHLDLFAIENSKIKRLDHTTILYKNKDLISEMFLLSYFRSQCLDHQLHSASASKKSGTLLSLLSF